MSTLMKFELAPIVLQFLAGGDYPAKRKNKIYQVQDKSAGGKTHVETLGIQVKTRVIQFNLMSDVDYFALVDFFLNVVNAGEKVFVFTDEYGNVHEDSRILNSEIDFEETSLGAHSGSITIEYP